jgi:hypothetical protein
VIYPRLNDAVALHTRNISASGLYAWAHASIPVAARADIAMLVPARDGATVKNDLVETQGRVVRCDPDPEGSGNAGRWIAIKFDSIAEEDRAKIDQYVQRHAPAP